MTWLAWRQLRAAAIAMYALLAVLLVVLLLTGIHINHLYSAYRSCSGLSCDSTLSRLSNYYPHLSLVGTALIAVPGVLGIFLGAPLVSRELENGTYRLAWTQSVGRTRWIVTRAGAGALAVAVAVGLFTFAFTWWSIPYDQTGGTRIDPGLFGQRGIAPVAYAVFAFALGAAAGALVRRTLAAMAITLGGFIGVRMLVQFLARPHLVAPLKKAVALTVNTPLDFAHSVTGGYRITPHGSPGVAHAWVLGSKLVDASGHAPTAAFLNRACAAVAAVPPPPPGQFKGPSSQLQTAIDTCVRNIGAHFHEVVTYQPASHFWALQWRESAIFFALAAALLGLAVYWVRRRLA